MNVKEWLAQFVGESCRPRKLQQLPEESQHLEKVYQLQKLQELQQQVNATQQERIYQLQQQVNATQSLLNSGPQVCYEGNGIRIFRKDATLRPDIYTTYVRWDVIRMMLMGLLPTKGEAIANLILLQESKEKTPWRYLLTMCDELFNKEEIE